MTYEQLKSQFPCLDKIGNTGIFIVELAQGLDKLNLKVKNGVPQPISRHQFDALRMAAGVNAQEIHFALNESIFRIPQDFKF